MVRAIARLPVRLGGKLLAGIAVIALLLAIVAVLGLVALSQSNSRGERLLSLQQTSGHAALLLGDATALRTLVATRGTRGYGTTLGVGSAADHAIDEDVLASWRQFLYDAQQPVQNVGSQYVNKLQTKLNAFGVTWLEVADTDLTGARKGALAEEYRQARQLSGQASLHCRGRWSFRSVARRSASRRSRPATSRLTSRCRIGTRSERSPPT